MAPLAIVMAMLMATMSVAAVSATHEDDTQHEWADDDFESTWARTDKPVADGQVQRTWMWGPAPYTEGMMEPYSDSPGGERLVQYTDKSRMEINDPNAPAGLWFVTNGLLVVEMVEGHYQTGDADFDEAPNPAEVNITGDPGDESGLSPTYADISAFNLRAAPARADGSVITATIDADGTIGDDPTKAELNVTSAHRVQVPTIDHQVASVFWEFMNSSGQVWENGALVTEPLFENPFYAVGFPITEAYWSTVMVGGSERDVLWQCFERRCLTYTPGNPTGFLVEAGNVGQHYYRWRHDDDGNGPPDDTENFEVQFGSLNTSGVSGSVLIALTGDQLVLDVNLTGLEPGDHPWHIHGFGDDTDASCPTMDLDTNENGLIELEEGLPAYGEVLVPLGTLTAGEDGVIDTTVTVTLTAEQMTALGEGLLDNVLVVHGMTVDLDGDGPGEEAYVETLPVACGDVNEPGFDGGAETIETTFEALNESGVSGTVTVTLINDLVTVTADLSGLEAGQVHPMHIHGLGDADASCPTMELDTNGNGYVELEEGEAAYGPVIVPLGAPMADAEGNLSFTGSFIVDIEALGTLANNVVVVHGLTADLDGEGAGEEAYVASLPVGCADLFAVETSAYTVTFTELNDSGVTATALLTLTGDQLTVHVEASGLVADQTHQIHIHGLAEGNATCPTADLDVNDDGFVDLEEGEPAYGDVLYPLGEPMADAEGNLTHETTIAVDPESLLPLEDRVLVIHGLTIEGTYDASMPVACGEVDLGLATATADIMDAEGETVGTALLVEAAAGVLVHVDVTAGVAAGEHGVAIYATGSCEAPDFASAGTHFNPTAATHPNHAGDLGNLLIADDGSGSMLVLAAGVTLGEGDTSLLDADGSAIIIHANPDDLATDPDGAAGARIACGVVTATNVEADA